MTKSTIIDDKIRVNYTIKNRIQVFEKVDTETFDKLVTVQKIQKLDNNTVYTDGMSDNEILLSAKSTLLGNRFHHANNFLIRTNKRLFLISVKYKKVIHKYGSFLSFPISIRDFCNRYNIVIDNMKQAKYNFKNTDFNMFHTFPVAWKLLQKQK